MSRTKGAVPTAIDVDTEKPLKSLACSAGKLHTPTIFTKQWQMKAKTQTPVANLGKLQRLVFEVLMNQGSAT